VLALLSESVPDPVLVRLTAPDVFLIEPANVELWLLAPTVKVAAAAELSTVPAPVRPLIVVLKPFKSSVPLTATFPVPAPLGSAPIAATWRMPVVIVVSPE